MDLTKVQISELMRKHAERENGLHDLLEIMLGYCPRLCVWGRKGAAAI